MRDLHLYAFAYAKIKAYSSYLLDEQKEYDLVHASDLNHALELLSDSQYADIVEKFKQDKNVRAFEKSLIDFDICLIKKICSFLKGGSKQFLEQILKRYELQNLKCILRLWQQKNDAEDEIPYLLPLDIYCDFPVKEMVFANDYDEFAECIKSTEYYKQLQDAKEMFLENGKLFYVEAALDVAYYKKLFSLLKKLSLQDQKSVASILGHEVDIENIRLLLRLKHQYNFSLQQILSLIIPHGMQLNIGLFKKLYEKERIIDVIKDITFMNKKEFSLLTQGAWDNSKLSMFESILWYMMLQQVKQQFRGFPFRIGVILSFVLLKQAETNFLISLVNSKLYNIPSLKKNELTGIFY